MPGQNKTPPLLRVNKDLIKDFVSLNGTEQKNFLKKKITTIVKLVAELTYNVIKKKVDLKPCQLKFVKANKKFFDKILHDKKVSKNWLVKHCQIIVFLFSIVSCFL